MGKPCVPATSRARGGGVAVLTAVVLLIGPALQGCQRPLEVHVVDASDGRGIAGARVRRMDMQRPYWIVGRIVAVEEEVTDAAGVARLRDRRGMRLDVQADGYHRRGADIEPETRSMRVPLQPLSDDEGNAPRVGPPR